MISRADRLAEYLRRLEEGAPPTELGSEAEELAELAEMAEIVRRLEPVPPPPKELAPGREAFVAAGVERARRLGRRPAWWQRLLGALGAPWPARRIPRLATAALALLVVLGSLFGTHRVAADSLPGDALYPVKRAEERAALALARGARADRLRAEQAARRRTEAAALLADGRTQSVRLEGQLTRAADGSWQLDGVPIALADATTVDGPIGPGARVLVGGTTGPDGRVQVARVTVLVPPPTATPTPTVGATATAAHVFATMTAPPRASPTPSRTATGTPVRPTATATATATGAPPTATPPPAVVPPEATRPTRVRWEGRLEARDGERWVVAGRAFDVADGEIDASLGPAEVGAWVAVEAEERDGQLQLIRLTVLARRGDLETLEWRGRIDTVAVGHWVVDGQRVELTADTAISGTPAVGRMATVRARRYPDGQLVAIEITVEPEGDVVQFTGALESFDADRWVVDGRTIVIDAATEIVGQPWVGAPVEVTAERRPDGSLLGRRLRVVEPAPAVTATPDGTPTLRSPWPTVVSPTPSPTRTPLPTPTLTPRPDGVVPPVPTTTAGVE